MVSEPTHIRDGLIDHAYDNKGFLLIHEQATVILVYYYDHEAVDLATAVI